MAIWGPYDQDQGQTATEAPAIEPKSARSEPGTGKILPTMPHRRNYHSQSAKRVKLLGIRELP